MEPSEYLAIFRREAAALADTPPAALDAAVPGCPDWNVAQLIGHTGWVYHFVGAVLAADGERPDRKTVPNGPEGESVLGWFRDAFAQLDATFDALDPTAGPYFAFNGPEPAAWWMRRMAHETAMHAWDARSALGAAAPFDAALAADGIDEAFEVMMPRRFDHGSFAEGTTAHLHASDHEGGEWFVSFGGDRAGYRWEHGHRKGDVAVRGPVSDLLLWCYGRVPTASLDVVGDEALAGRIQAAMTF
ncbi:MAG: maleylpyruvate isomerase family mycothiol-dependent enzyme [Acidimicrobiia bacterium]|nr:maleylpyruvate isomerase family mycothiol-dependent enzyme [Acidimicrobiia bacterium]